MTQAPTDAQQMMGVMAEWVRMQDNLVRHTQRMVARQQEWLRAIIGEGLAIWQTAATVSNAEEQRAAQKQLWQLLQMQSMAAFNDMLREMVSLQAELNQQMNKIWQMSLAASMPQGSTSQAFPFWLPLPQEAKTMPAVSTDPAAAAAAFQEVIQQSLQAASQMTTDAWQRLMGMTDSPSSSSSQEQPKHKKSTGSPAKSPS